MTRSSAKKQQQLTSPSVDDASPAITKDVYDAVVARVAELEAEVADQRSKLTEAAKDVSAAKEARRGDSEALARVTTERDGAFTEAANQAKLAEMRAELTARDHKDALATAVQAEKDAGAATLAGAQALLQQQLAELAEERDAQRQKAEELERQLSEARNARRTSGASAKKARKSNWPREKRDEEGEAPVNACAAAFLEDGGGVRVKAKRGAAKVEINYVARPFQVAGCGAEDFFASINVTDQASLHKLVYESGYWWNIASFAGAPYNADVTKPCQCIDVLKYVQHDTKFEIDGQACATRKVWLAMHLWPSCDAMKDGSIKNLPGNQQSLLKKYVTGINQMTNFYNKYMADTEGFTPLLASAPPPERKSGTKRAREDEGEAEGEAPMEDTEAPIVSADDEALPPIAVD